jgi:hypothetical protein
MAGCSLGVAYWFIVNIRKDLQDPDLSPEEFNMRLLANFANNIDFKFQYLFSI